MPTNNGSSWITQLRRVGLYLRDGFQCGYCGADLRAAWEGGQRRDLTLDHLDTRKKCEARKAAGLDMHPSHRLVTACRSCNSERGDRMTWRAFALQKGGQAAVDRIARSTTRVVERYVAQARNILDGNGDSDLEGWT